jgi:large repetitive protein
LPTGLALDASTGALSGTPSAAGTFTGTVRATNSAGVANQNFSIAIAATVPGAPLIGGATPGNAQASISFTPPASNGGSAITGYTATCNPGNISGSGAGSPLTVAGLSNGVTYSCSVRANSAMGSSAASGSVNVTPGGGPAFTSAAAPGGTFGVAYSHTFAATGSPVPTFALASGVIPPGLTLNGTTGVLAGTPVEAATFTGVINASNALGTASQAFAITIAPTLAGAPTIGSASPGSNSAVISFTPPASNGGSPITAYTVTCNPGNKVATGSASPVTVMQLANSTTYTCAVRAENAAGLGPSSGTVTVTPGNVSSGGTAPSFSSPAPSPGTFGVPYSHTFVASGTPAPTFSVSFGSLPTGLTLNPTTGAVTGTPTEVGSFTGEITAASSSGFATQLFDIPITALVPSAPTLDSATPGDSQATFAFTAPVSNGGAPITSYTVICNPGNANAAAAASAITVGGLANGTTYTCAVRAFNSAGGSPASNALTVTPAPVVVNPARLANISTRMQVLTGNDAMIGGFVIGGNATKTVVIRAIGPSLANYGVAGTLPNPTMQIIRMSDQSTIATNDDWANAPNAADLAASGFAPSDPRESAVLITLGPGAYTAIVSGVGGTTGVGIVEVYEVDAPTVPLINISTRGQVRTGFDQMIGGFVVQGTGRQKVVIRAIGPSLANFGISGTLPNPVMQLVRLADQATIATNDDWGSASNAAEIVASGFAPSNPLEATILITLDPGAYTVIISGSGGSTGVGIFEVYTVP